MSDDWTTRIAPHLTSRYGVEEVHTAWFLPKGWPGKGNAVSLLIPECELQYVFLAPDGAPVACVNRPNLNKNIKTWIRSACKAARDYRASIAFACDTSDQVEKAVKLAARLLPDHERIALERMYEASSRSLSGLN